MHSFELLYGGYWFRVNAEDYVVQESDRMCSLCLGYHEDFWILGDVFLRGWYTMHDLTNMRIGFHSIDTTKKPIPTEEKNVPTESLPNDLDLINPSKGSLDYGQIYGMTSFSFLVLTSFGAFACFTFVIVVIICY